MSAPALAMDGDRAWRAVLARDTSCDGTFVYAVRSTGIYCRPSCPSRRPRRANVTFFPAPRDAERAGFRACFRCKPRDPAAAPTWLARALARLDREEPVTLAVLARECGLSLFHLQRTFKRLTGVSPREYRRARRSARFRSLLGAAPSVTDAIYAAGYGSSSRAYERVDGELGMTPATYRRGGRGAAIGFTVVTTTAGRLLVATTERGVCAVRFGGADAALEAELRREFPAARLRRLARGRDAWVRAIVGHVERGQPLGPVPLDVRATAFQRRVWRALRAIPAGSVRSYREVAAAIGAPAAVRAVASACAHNPVAVVVPCHRVVRADGAPGGYRWGVRRKRLLLARERRFARET
jgi:AraC family transcriptional regulator of adaptative response/methylated-DNA-[protein]-cysteine methyltransferase